MLAISAAAMALTATSAQAAVLVTNVQLAGPPGYYTVVINNEPVYDAALVLTIDGNQVLVNCDDLFHNIDIGQSASFNVGAFRRRSAQPILMGSAGPMTPLRSAP